MHARLFFAAALAVSSAALHADTQTDPGIDEIIVSGARAPIARADIGNAVTVITRSDIELRQARDLTELLASVPGFSVSRSGGFGAQTQVRVRGTEANHMLVLVDGNRVSDPGAGDEFRWEFMSTAFVERIEIVRGAQSALWGSDAVAGVVNIITRKPEQGSEVYGYVEGGSFDTLNAALAGGVANDAWGATLGVERLDTGGDNIARVGDEADGATLSTLTATGFWQAGDALRIEANARLADADTEFDTVDFIATGLPADSDSESASQTLTAQVRALIDGDNLKHSAYVRYFDSDTENFEDGLDNGSVASDRLSVGYQLDLELAGNGLSLAAEYESSDFSQRGEIVFGDPNQDQSIDAHSLVVDYRGVAAERLSWLLSARFDNNSDFDDVFNGRASLAWQWTDALRLRGSIGTGQKNPTFIERFGFFPGQFVGNPDLKPERATSIEFGVDGVALDEALDWQITLFHQDLDDEINGFVFDPVTFEVTADNIDGDSTRQGGEAALSWTLSDAVAMSASYTYVDATEEDASGNDVDELRRPRHSGAFGVDVRALDARWLTQLTAEFGGEREDIFFPPFPQASRRETLDSYWLIGLTTQYALTPQVTVYAKGTNLLDEDYEEVFGYRTRGRAGFVGVRMQFGR